MKKIILNNPQNVTFDDLIKICRQYFGEPRIRGSHYIFKTPWKGDPRINLQKDKDVAKAIKKLEAQREEQD